MMLVFSDKMQCTCRDVLTTVGRKDRGLRLVQRSNYGNDVIIIHGERSQVSALPVYANISSISQILNVVRFVSSHEGYVTDLIQYSADSSYRY